MQINLKRVAFVLSFTLFSSFAIGQNDNVSDNTTGQPFTELKKDQPKKPSKTIPVLTFQKPDVATLLAEDEKNDKNGEMYRFGSGIEVNITTQNSGEWTTKENGDRVWNLKIHQPEALALSFIFSTFELNDEAFINVYNEKGQKVHKTYTQEDVLPSGQQNLSLCEGDLLTLELVEPKGTSPSTLEMENLVYIYRSFKGSGFENKSFGDSDNCQVNVNCPEGNDWKDEKKGVARILIYKNGGNYWCTGSLVNNTDEDCKPYFLTAMHCADGTSASDLNQWRFYFNYEAPGCSDPSQNQVPTNYITGGERLAGSDDGANIDKSDFFLIRLGTAANESSTISTLKSYDAYWNGWNANNTASSGGVGIHHPSGDIKKISTYTQTLQSISYSGVNANTHWRVYWSQTASGHGVTEGGSSGSPLFTYNGGNSHIVGTLSGGSSYCYATNNPDAYGKMSYHWTSAGSNNSTQLKPWLDPGNTGVKVFDGSSDPCDEGTGGGGDPNPGGCQPDPGSCDEYIANVTLGGINNATGCDGYTDYSNFSTTVTAGNTYQIAVTPGILGEQGAAYYEGDVIGAWVDWSGSGTFAGSNEEIFTEAISQTSPGGYAFTVPSSVDPGTYVLRVRIVYDAYASGVISPCADSDYGEIEDYRIVVEGGETSSLVDFDKNAMRLYPNPTTDQVTLDLNATYKNVEVVIYDLTGKVVSEILEHNKQTLALDFAEFDAGIYQVAVKTEHGKVIKKMVKK